MVRRAAELVVGTGLLLGPLAYALTLEPEVQTEVVVIQEAPTPALAERSEPVVPTVEPAPAPPPAPAIETATAEPPLGSDRIDFALVNEAGLVLSTEADAAWGTGRLRRHSGPGHFRAAKRANGRTVPAELWAQRGRTFDLYGTEGKVCTARLGELDVLAQHDGPSEFYLFHPDEMGDWEVFESDPPSKAEVRQRVWSLAEHDEPETSVTPWLVAEIISDEPCKGALWARDSELPPPALLHPSEEPSPLTERRLAQHESSTELAETRASYEDFYRHLDDEEREYYGTWERLSREHPATVRSWLDDEGQAHFLELHFGSYEGSCGEGYYAEITALDAVEGEAIVPSGNTANPVMIFDADLDGRFEVLYLHEGEGSGGTLVSETLDRWWSIDAVFSCPC